MGFSWGNFSRGTLRELARASGLRVSHAEADLRERYGDVPSETFIEELWLVIRDRWLMRTPPAREQMVEGLRAARLGRMELKVRSRAEQMAYLRTCRMSEALKRLALQVFIAGGERPFTEAPSEVDETAEGPPSEDPAHVLQQACRDIREEGIPLIELILCVQIGSTLDALSLPVPPEERKNVAGEIVMSALMTLYRNRRRTAETETELDQHRAAVFRGTQALAKDAGACKQLIDEYYGYVISVLEMATDRRALQLDCTSLLVTLLAFGSLQGASTEAQQSVVEGMAWISSALDRIEQEKPDVGDPAETSDTSTEAAREAPSLEAFVDQVLRSHWNPIGPTPVRDCVTGWVLKHGSATTDIQLHLPAGEPPLLIYRADLLRGVTAAPTLLATLNDINRREFFNKVYAEENVVVLEYAQFVEHVTAFRLAATVSAFIEAADEYDTILQERFGGQMYAADVKARFNV